MSETCRSPGIVGWGDHLGAGSGETPNFDLSRWVIDNPGLPPREFFAIGSLIKRMGAEVLPRGRGRCEGVCQNTPEINNKRKTTFGNWKTESGYLAKSLRGISH